MKVTPSSSPPSKSSPVAVRFGRPSVSESTPAPATAEIGNDPAASLAGRAAALCDAADLPDAVDTERCLTAAAELIAEDPSLVRTTDDLVARLEELGALGGPEA